MHIHKSSAYSPLAAAQMRNGGSINDRHSQRQNLPARINHALSPQINQAQDSSTGPTLGEAADARIKAHRKVHFIDERILHTVNPKLDRKNQTALNAYESLLYQSEKEQRESVSRLLGVDLYV